MPNRFTFQLRDICNTPGSAVMPSVRFRIGFHFLFTWPIRINWNHSIASGLYRDHLHAKSLSNCLHLRSYICVYIYHVCSSCNWLLFVDEYQEIIEASLIIAVLGFSLKTLCSQCRNFHTVYSEKRLARAYCILLAAFLTIFLPVICL